MPVALAACNHRRQGTTAVTSPVSPDPPVVSATAAPPTAADVAAAGHSAAATPATIYRACAEANAVAARGAAVATATPTFASPTTPNPPAPPRLLPSHTPAAPTVRHGSRRTPNAVPNAILYLPGRICPLCSGGGRVLDTHTCVRCSYRCSMGEWGACRSQDCVEAGMCARTGIDAYRFVALSHETVMTKCQGTHA